MSGPLKRNADEILDALEGAAHTFKRALGQRQRDQADGIRDRTDAVRDKDDELAEGSGSGGDGGGSNRPPTTTGGPPDGGGADIPVGKFDYLFGRVSSNSHNAARSAQNAAQLARIGLHDSPAARRLLQEHFDEVVADSTNIMRTFTTEHGTFQIRDSLFAGPGGFLHFESTWQVTDGGGLRLTTVIPRGGQ